MTQLHQSLQEKQISLVSDDECFKIVSNRLQSSNFRILNVRVLPFGEGTSGFLGACFKIEISVFEGASSKQLNLEFFAKTKPAGQQAHTELVNSTIAFQKESQFFCSFYYDMKKLYEEKLVSAGKKTYFCVCPCYFANNEVIVLENLLLKGFKVHESRKLFDFKHCSLVLQALAQFHAASVAFGEKESKHGQRKIIEVYPELCDETFWLDFKKHPGYEINKAAYEGMVHLVELLPNYGKHSEHYDFIIAKLPETMKKVFQLVKPSTRFRNVICHGDLWENNIMFRYDSAGDPVELRFIDFQLVRYCPPAHDVTMFLHLVTSREFRDTHLGSLQEIYYESLSTELKCYNLDVEKILPWTEFLDSCEEYITLSLITASMYNQFGQIKSEVMAEIMSDAEKMQQIFFGDKSEFLVQQYTNDVVFKERYKEVLEELIEKCILNEHSL